MAEPPTLRMPKALQTLGFLARELPLTARAQRELGDVFSISVSGLPPLVIVADPALVKEIFTSDASDLRAGEGNSVLLPLVGASSVLLLDEAAHMRQRKLMLPPLHGDRMRIYGEVMREITDDEIDSWPLNQPFSMHQSTQAITLRVILRTVFGVEDGAQMADLERLLPKLVDLGQWVTMIPALQRGGGRASPWGRFLQAREQVDAILFDEIERRRLDSEATAERSDVLSLLMQARDEDGEPMTDLELRDELLSEGVIPGTIQLPPDGNPILLMADCAPTGGYPRIGHVITADLGIAAQLRPGQLVRFAMVTLDQAQVFFRQQRQMLTKALIMAELMIQR